CGACAAVGLGFATLYGTVWGGLYGLLYGAPGMILASGLYFGAAGAAAGALLGRGIAALDVLECGEASPLWMFLIFWMERGEETESGGKAPHAKTPKAAMPRRTPKRAKAAT